MLYTEFVGLRSEPVKNLVERGAVRRFAEAIADPSPLYTDEESGRREPLRTFPRAADLPEDLRLRAHRGARRCHALA